MGQFLAEDRLARIRRGYDHVTAARGRRYDVTFLCDADVPWMADDVRYFPSGGAAFFARCEETLRREGRDVVVLRGSWAEREEAAARAIEALIES